MSLRSGRRAPPSEPAQRLVERDAGEPSGQLRIAPEAVEMRKGADVCLLNHVLRLGIILQDAAGHAVEPAIVPLHDEPDGSPPDVAGQGDQRPVVEVVQAVARPLRDCMAKLPYLSIRWSAPEKVPGCSENATGRSSQRWRG